MTDKMTSMYKIKRVSSANTSQHFYSTFNFAQTHFYTSNCCL